VFGFVDGRGVDADPTDWSERPRTEPVDRRRQFIRHDAAKLNDALTVIARRLAAVRHIVVRVELSARADCQPFDTGGLPLPVGASSVACQPVTVGAGGSTR
jgi:hypothetical protein